MQDKDLQLKRMLETNKVQKDFYEYQPQEDQFEYDGNIIGRTWAKLRSEYGKVVNSLGEFEMWSNLHWKWMGDLSNKKVLDLGCHAGNQLSLDLAKKAKYYVGLDLSESATAELQRKINDAGIENAITVATDFLSGGFTERDFDIVYAQSVFHHFKYMEPFLERVNEVLAPGGQIITSDPLATYWPLKILRAIYRPFQRDSDWEYPFTKKTFDLFQKYFIIENLQGMMGSTKWVLLIYPFSKKLGEKKWQQWLKEDQSNANKIGNHLWKCMRVTINLHKKNL
ncbi:class I SAM-dependent methyltransferase [Saprospiraceae bacterium]|jgi:2-polyprenyl-3-methyl-5-hydroxy-6-metoxy-1,4-benzoquinol methylase|nr:class I SAM-dependent methyltransferase [Saprospiraceae bacterium]MDG1433878.1 class I SAM-dependent methyltransferase [Saprospiraceae bacterium]